MWQWGTVPLLHWYLFQSTWDHLFRNRSTFVPFCSTLFQHSSQTFRRTDEYWWVARNKSNVQREFPSRAASLLILSKTRTLFHELSLTWNTRNKAYPIEKPCETIRERESWSNYYPDKFAPKLSLFRASKTFFAINSPWDIWPPISSDKLSVRLASSNKVRILTRCILQCNSLNKINLQIYLSITRTFQRNWNKELTSIFRRIKLDHPCSLRSWNKFCGNESGCLRFLQK